jgi:hypothetical protein
MSQEPAVTAIARSRGTRRGVARTALLVLAEPRRTKAGYPVRVPCGDGGSVSARPQLRTAPPRWPGCGRAH